MNGRALCRVTYRIMIVFFLSACHSFQLTICCLLSSKFDAFLRHGKRWKVTEWWTEKGKASVRKDLFSANCMNWGKGNKKINKQNIVVRKTKWHSSKKVFFPSFSLAESSPRELKITSFKYVFCFQHKFCACVIETTPPSKQRDLA